MRKKLISVILIVLIVVVGGVYLNKYHLLPFVNNKTTTTPEKIDPLRKILVKDTVSVDYGHYMTDGKGRALYIFSSDEQYKSSCTGECAKTWIPYTRIERSNAIRSYYDTLSRRLDLVVRDDGSRQYAYLGRPLYYYVGDKINGDLNGLGITSFGGKWGIIKLSGKLDGK